MFETCLRKFFMDFCQHISIKLLGRYGSRSGNVVFTVYLFGIRFRMINSCFYTVFAKIITYFYHLGAPGYCKVFFKSNS